METTENAGKNLEIHLLHAETIYQKNISLSRFRYSRQLGDAFREAAERETPPDAIYCSYPLIDFAYEAVTYGKRHNVPVIVDVRDLWPDIYYRAIPKSFVPLLRVALREAYRRASFIFKNASEITATVPNSLEWVKQKYHRACKSSKVFYLGYQIKKYPEEDIENSIAKWLERGITKDRFIVCFFGNIENSGIMEYDSIIKAAENVLEYQDIIFVICGRGAYLQTLEKRTEALNNVILPGYMDQIDIQTLMSISSIGLLPYRNTFDFRDTIPNKGIEYLAGELPVLTMLEGEYWRIIKENHCGLHYSSDEELAENIVKLHDDRSLLRDMEKNARRLYEERFTAKKIYGEFCDAIEGIALNVDASGEILQPVD
jgi:glycosyltransferase involved in cell wall biosynthesis